MTHVDEGVLVDCIARARLAPSVHNVQPARWRFEDGKLKLFGNPSSAIPVADPDGRDWRLSIGAHLEGLSLALGERGLALSDLVMHDAQDLAGAGGLVRIADVVVAPVEGGEGPGLRDAVATRASWRGGFSAMAPDALKRIKGLQVERDDCLVITSGPAIQRIAKLADRAALHFLRDYDHRAELVSWLRLSRNHPRYHLDGLNARAMNMSGVESWGAGLVLGSLFEPLDKVGLAGPLVNEASKMGTAGAIILFHRPDGEDAFVSGRAFYRAWLAMECAGVAGCPVSVLADWAQTRDALAKEFGIPEGRTLVSVFRMGKPKGARTLAHARLPVEELLV